jgi:hypothetical protein
MPSRTAFTGLVLELLDYSKRDVPDGQLIEQPADGWLANLPPPL